MRSNKNMRTDLLLKIFFLLSGILLVVAFCHILHYPDPGPVPKLTTIPPPDIFEQRKIHVQNMCKQYWYKSTGTTKEIREYTLEGNNKSLSTYQMQHMFVDHNHKVLYCFVPKVGCTNWKRVMMMLTGKATVQTPTDIPRALAHKLFNHKPLSLLRPDLKRTVLKDYKKFLIVRDPLERLLSAYRNKFESKTAPADYFHQEIGSKIIRTYRKHATDKEVKEGTSVTFPEFVRYVTESDFSLNWNKNQSLNEHWEPINGLCSPCTVQYDYIAQFDNLVEESNMILQRINSDIKYPAGEDSIITHTGTRDKMNKYYDDIPLKDIRVLERIYGMDNLLFNYSTKEAIGVKLT